MTFLFNLRIILYCVILDEDILINVIPMFVILQSGIMQIFLMKNDIFILFENHSILWHSG
jgi:hypothetical protein